MNLNPDNLPVLRVEAHKLSHHLRCAAEFYLDCARGQRLLMPLADHIDGHRRLVEQFNRQAEECHRWATAIEHDSLLVTE